MHFAAIGTREPAPAQLEQLYRWLGGLSRTRDNAVLHTGAAPGVDQLAALRWLQDGGDVHLHLPWPAYERTWVENIVREYGGRRCVVDRPAEPAEDALRLAALHHPRWETLGRGPRSLHARNVEIVRPVTLGVIALPGTVLQQCREDPLTVCEARGVTVRFLPLGWWHCDGHEVRPAPRSDLAGL